MTENIMTLQELCEMFSKSKKPIKEWWTISLIPEAKHILINVPYLENNKKVILGDNDD